MATIEEGIHAFDVKYDDFIDGFINILEGHRNQITGLLREGSLLYSMILVMMMQLNITELEIENFDAKIEALNMMVGKMAVSMSPIEDGKKGRIWLHPAKEVEDSENSDSDTLP